jgi:hypothetical protein
MPPLKQPKNIEGSSTTEIDDLMHGVLAIILSLLPAHDAVSMCVYA